MTQQLSNCCKAQVSVSSSDEGTSCFMCGECKQPCDLHHVNRLMIAQEIQSDDTTKANSWAMYSQEHYVVIEREEYDRLKEIEAMYEGLCK